MTSLRKILAVLTGAERRRGAGLLGLTLIGTFLETLGVTAVIPAIILLVQTDLTQSARLAPWLARLGNPSSVQLARWGMLALVAIYLVKTGYLAFLAWQQTKYASQVQANLGQRLLAIYLRQPYAFHLERNSGELMHTVGHEVGMYATVLTSMMLLITEGLVLLSVAVLLFAVEPVGALVVIAVLGSAGWLFHRATRSRITRWGLARQYHIVLRSKHIVQALGGVKDVVLLGREDEFLRQFTHHDVETARATHRQAAVVQLPRLWLELLGVGGLAALVLTQLARGTDMKQIVPTVGLFAAAAFRLMPSVNRVMGGLQSLRYSLPVVDTLNRELALPTNAPRRVGAEPLPLRDQIKVDRVTFKYQTATKPALKDISLVVRRGESVGFIGPSGSGKSTLVDVILGLLRADSGRIVVDGRDVYGDLRAWQDQIGYVSQHIYLVDDTLVQNVAFGVPPEQINLEAVWRALRAAQLEEFIASLPEGVHTVVGERGVRLSGGQRQRIGIARALYHDPPVLVLDEATSALDGETERGVMDAVAALRHDKTILIVAHRLSTVEQCDRLYRLDQGQVVAEGSPAEVLGAHRVT